MINSLELLFLLINQILIINPIKAGIIWRIEITIPDEIWPVTNLGSFVDNSRNAEYKPEKKLNNDKSKKHCKTILINFNRLYKLEPLLNT